MFQLLSCLATFLEHDASETEIEDTKDRNVLAINMIEKMKHGGGGRTRFISLMLVFFVSRAAGRYCLLQCFGNCCQL